jgi:hypothetical protein
MKSCRNCAHSRQSGAHRVELVCPVNGRRVAPTPSMNTEENIKADRDCRDIAARCHAYEPEGESK